jgi:hypothetical protein
MNEEVQALLRKARRFLRSAENQLRSAFFEDAASRAYYAMFTAAKAMLLLRTPKVSKHEHVQRGFEELFVRTGIVERKYLSYLEVAFQSRHFADYETDLVYITSPEEAETRFREASEFVAMAEEFLGTSEGETKQR